MLLIFSTAQQHSRTITTQSAPDPPSNSLQVLNNDALSTESSIPPNTGITQTDTSDPVLSQSLPPVPVAMQQRILRGEYIDFNTLLPEVMFSVATSTPAFPNPDRSQFSHQKSPLSLLGWMPGISILLIQ